MIPTGIQGRTARVIALAALVLLVSTAAVRAEEDPVSARAFEVHHRPIADVADLVGPLLSDEGQVTIKPRLDSLVVQDRVSVLDRVGSLIASYDLPPRDVEVTLSLFLGTDRRDDSDDRQSSGTGFSKEVRGVLETLRDITKWSSYEALGSRSLTGVEGEQVTAEISDEYRVLFTVDVVQEQQGKVTFKRFTLQRMSRDESGAVKIEDLYTTAMVLPLGRLRVVGAASGADSKRALFLTLQAETR